MVTMRMAFWASDNTTDLRCPVVSHHSQKPDREDSGSAVYSNTLSRKNCRNNCSFFTSFNLNKRTKSSHNSYKLRFLSNVQLRFNSLIRPFLENRICCSPTTALNWLNCCIKAALLMASPGLSIYRIADTI